MAENPLNEKIAEASKTIFSYCRAKTPNREEAEDLAQDILFELVKSAQNIRDERAFYGFMWAVADNIYKQWCRKRNQLSTCELTDDIPCEGSVFPSDEENADLYLLRRELSLLAEKYRKATILYYIDRKSCEKIAEALSISENMVKYLLFKSRKILKEGMNMERKLGSLSYNPKTLIPLYSGEGPNRFWDFMQSKIRQNIIAACYNDSLTPAQISLETGIPLPYLDGEIAALTDKNLLLCEGGHYKTNLVIITEDCRRAISKNAIPYHEKIADAISKYIDAHLAEFRVIGFAGSGFSEKSLRWMFATLIFRAVLSYDDGTHCPDKPRTAWGERAYLYCTEETPDAPQSHFAYSYMESGDHDGLYFLDYIPSRHGNHHDFYGNKRYVNIVCDIAKGCCEHFSEYDLEAVADMLRLGYIAENGDGYQVTFPVYTGDAYQKAEAMAWQVVTETLADTLHALTTSTEKILSDHTPRHVQNQVAGIAGISNKSNAISAAAEILIEKGALCTDWHPAEMPTTYLVIRS